MSQPVAESRRYTYGDYASWDGDQRWELIDGRPYAMSPAPHPLHQELLGALFAQIHAFLEGKPCKVYLAPFDVRLPDAGEPDSDVPTVVQPDISVICDLTKLDDLGCRGAPDWIVEVLSPSTAAKDQTVKRALYECHGVREYWLAHPTDRVVMVYRLDDTGRRYAGAEVHAMEGRLACSVDALAGLVIDWARA